MEQSREPSTGVPSLPEPRVRGQYAVALVCLGNICRSPMADVVLSDRVAAAGLADRVTIASSGTGDWHVGGPMDHRAADALRSAGLDPSRHRARQFAAAWLDEHDLVLAMDRTNLQAIRALGKSRPDDGRVRLFRDFDPVDPGKDVPDPYYGGSDGFEEVLAMVERTADVLADALRRLLESETATR